MSDLSLHLFGPPKFEMNGTPVHIPRRKATALLVYLAVSRQEHSRDTLATLLWSENDQSSARAELRRTLSVLNRVLGEGWLRADRETVSWSPNPDNSSWLDVADFQDKLKVSESHDHPTNTACPDCVPILDEAVELYLDDFMAGFSLKDCREYEEWQFFKREELRNQLANALVRLCSFYESSHDYEMAIQYARRWLTLDPLQEAAYRQLMSLFAQSGQRSAALNIYQQCAQALDIELGSAPSWETTALYESIQRDETGISDRPPKTGTIRGYEIREHLGSGHMAAVYKAYQPVIGRDVAIKVILPQLANHPDFIRRFEVEAQLVARLEHPHIVPLYDYWRDPSGAYLVMRWLKGGSLQVALGQGPWKPVAAVELVEQISAALALAHQQGVVHCDIKPANILLDEENNAYLSDFGIAILTGPLAQLNQRNQSSIGSSSPGSLGYTSPEITQNQAPTALADIYSLGVVIYELLTGEPPFPGIEGQALIQKHLSEPLPSVLDLRPELPQAVDAVIQQATQKNPNARFQDVESLASAFRRALLPKSIRLPQIATIKVIDRNPYKGLRPFAEADQSDFFGRDQLVSRLLERLSSGNGQLDPARFLAVVGPSGSGKSSLVKAGLIPAIRTGAIPGSENWFVAEMTPGSVPFEELETALLRIASETPQDLAEQLRVDSRGLIKVLRRTLPNNDSRVLLLIDQFEELFSLVENRADRDHFLEMVSEAVNDPHSPLSLVITLRADFYDRPLEHSQFGELVREATEAVLPLNAQELEQAICGPADGVGVKLEPTLVAQIVSDVGEQPGALPLLQYALTETFEQRLDDQMTLAAYQANGGVLGALGRRAEEIYNQLDESEGEITRQLFLRLVTLGEGIEDTRRRVLRSELVSLSADQGALSKVIDAYGRYRLLTFDHDPATRAPTVEVAHEALLREWPRLRAWLDESRDDIRMQRLLGATTKEWLESGQDPGFLLRGARLDQFALWAEDTNVALTANEGAFLADSLAKRSEREAAEAERQVHEARLEQRSRRFSWALVGVFAVATLIAVILSVLTFNQNRIAQENAATATYAQGEALLSAHAEATSAAEALDQKKFAEDEADARATQQAIAEAEVIARATAQAEAETAKEEAQRQASVGLANAALLELQNGLQDRAVNLALEALENYPYTFQAEQALSQAVMQSRLRKIFYDIEWVGFVKWSPDGKRLLSASEDGTVKIREPSSGKELLSLNHDSQVNFVNWSDDGTQVLTVDRVLTDDAENNGEEKWDIILWDSYSGERLVVMEGHTAFIQCAYWSPDGARILSGSGDATARIWDAKTGKLLQVLEHNGQVFDARWSPDGKTLVTMGDDPPTIWDASTAEKILTLKSPVETTTDGQWSPAGDRLLTNSAFAEQNSTRIWDTSNGELLLELPILASWSESQWSPDDQKILVRDRNIPQPRIYDAVTGEKLLELDPGISKPIPTVIDWSPSGDRVAAGYFDGSVVVWEAGDGDILFVFRGHTAQVTDGFFADALDWSPDGRWLASGSRDGSVMVWDTRTNFNISNLPGNARWSPTGDRILLAHGTGANIYEAASGDLLLTVELGFYGGYGDYWSPLGDKFGLGLENGEVRIYDASTGVEDLRIVLPGNLELYEEKGATWTFFGWSPDGQRIATGHDFDGSIRIWNALSGEQLQILRDEIENFRQDEETWFSEVRWSPLGDKILTADTLQHLIVWDANTGEELLHIADFDDDQIWKAAWSPDGTRIATHTRGNIGNIWDATTGEKLLQFSGHTGEVWGLFWSPSGERLATGGYDNAVRVWDTTTGEQVLHYPFDRVVDHVDWSPDGATLLISNTDQILVLPVWHSTQELIDYARECCLVRELTPEERTQFGLPEK